MQKFIQGARNFAVTGTNSAIALNLTIPEEVIIKRFVLQVVQSTPTTSDEDGAFIASIIQTDNNTPDLADADDTNRLVRSGCGSVNSPLNLDDTITMRKLAGSSVAVVLENVSGSSESYAVKLTLHYLEV